MGIKGLLQQLQPLVVGPKNENTSIKIAGEKGRVQNQKANIRDFSNQTLAIDASSWLYKAGYSCAEKLVEIVESQSPSSSNQNAVDSIIARYMIKRCQELLTYASIGKILLVFDGYRRGELKSDTNTERTERRRQNLDMARMLKSRGRTVEASEKYKACVKVPHDMTIRVARIICAHNFTTPQLQNGKNMEPLLRCVFSPFEADSQLAKLCMDGLADAVVTEDSDLLVYSAVIGKCFPIILKLDRNNGSCDVISMKWLLSKNNSVSIERKAKGAMAGYLRYFASRERRCKGDGIRMFVQACVLAGCDYISSLKGVGPVTAFKLIKDNGNVHHNLRFRKVVRSVIGNRKAAGTNRNNSDSDSQNENDDDDISTPLYANSINSLEDYEKALCRAETMFFHHCVYNVDSGHISNLLPLSSSFSVDSIACDQKRTEHDSRCSADNHIPASHSTNPSSPSLNFEAFENDISFLGSMSQFSEVELNMMKEAYHDWPKTSNSSSNDRKVPFIKLNCRQFETTSVSATSNQKKITSMFSKNARLSPHFQIRKINCKQDTKSLSEKGNGTKRKLGLIVKQRCNDLLFPRETNKKICQYREPEIYENLKIQSIIQNIHNEENTSCHADDNATNTIADHDHYSSSSHCRNKSIASAKTNRPYHKSVFSGLSTTPSLSTPIRNHNIFTQFIHQVDEVTLSTKEVKKSLKTTPAHKCHSNSGNKFEERLSCPQSPKRCLTNLPQSNHIFETPAESCTIPKARRVTLSPSFSTEENNLNQVDASPDQERNILGFRGQKHDKEHSIGELPRIASFKVNGDGENSFMLIVSKGSIVDFSSSNSNDTNINSRSSAPVAIVNAANERCLFGGGVDGAISNAGGQNLHNDRKKLPIINDKNELQPGTEMRGSTSVRCPTGDAKITGPNKYGLLKVPYVIHAVGPDYYNYENCDISKGDLLLKSAYLQSMTRAKEQGLEVIAFSLISSGVFRGKKRSLEDVLRIGIHAIVYDFGGYNRLREVHMCGYTQIECDTLIKIASTLDLKSCAHLVRPHEIVNEDDLSVESKRVVRSQYFSKSTNSKFKADTDPRLVKTEDEETKIMDKNVNAVPCEILSSSFMSSDDESICEFLGKKVTNEDTEKVVIKLKDRNCDVAIGINAVNPERSFKVQIQSHSAKILQPRFVSPFKPGVGANMLRTTLSRTAMSKSNARIKAASKLGIVRQDDIRAQIMKSSVLKSSSTSNARSAKRRPQKRQRKTSIKAFFMPLTKKM